MWADPFRDLLPREKGGDITNPANWEKVTIYQDMSVYTYHRVRFLDCDGDGDEDIITTRLK